MFEPLQKFIPKAAARHGIARELDAASACHIFRTLIPEIFKNTPTPQSYIAPAHAKAGTLTINVKTPAWAQEVIMRKSEIIKQMNEKAGKKIIFHLRTQLFS